MKLVIAEKPSVAMALVKVIGANKLEDSYQYIKMKGGKPASKTEKPDPDADYCDEDEIELTEEPEDSD